MCSTDAALSCVLLLLRGTSGLEIKLSDRPLSISDVENPISEAPGSLGGSSGNEDSDEEQGFVSSVVAREQPQQQRRVRWGDLPTRHDGEKQTHDGDAEVRRVRRERDKHGDDVKVRDSGSVDETSELLQQVTLSDAPASPEHSLNTNLIISQVGMSRKTAAGLRNLLKSRGNAGAEAPTVTLGLLESLTHTLMEWRTDETMR